MHGRRDRGQAVRRRRQAAAGAPSTPAGMREARAAPPFARGPKGLSGTHAAPVRRPGDETTKPAGAAPRRHQNPTGPRGEAPLPRPTSAAMQSSSDLPEDESVASALRDAGDVRPVGWGVDAVRLLDQRRLPAQELWLDIKTARGVALAIRQMVVRGAPAIGIAAAYAVVLAVRDACSRYGQDWRRVVRPELAALREARPTAVNLAWAVDHMEAAFPALDDRPATALLERARALHQADVDANRRMGASGATLLAPGARVLTHCNAGALATGGYGTALGVVRAAHAAGRLGALYATETRPWLQGARLTAWELSRAGIPFELIADGAAATLMARRGLDWVVVGADRVTANGDVVNKVGTYALALAARAHGARLMVVAPSSTLDLRTPSGAAVAIEDRDGGELLGLHGQQLAAPGARAWNPVFDVTPAALVDALVTELGVVRSPDTARLAALTPASSH